MLPIQGPKGVAKQKQESKNKTFVSKGGGGPSRIPGFGGGDQAKPRSMIPMSPSKQANKNNVQARTSTNTDEASQKAEDQLEQQQQQSAAAAETEAAATAASMTASFHSRTCSLPRQRRTSGSPANVAVVSPMPTTKHPHTNTQVKRSASDSCSESIVAAAATAEVTSDKENNTKDDKKDDPLKAIVPMQPLFDASQMHHRQEVTVNNAQLLQKDSAGKQEHHSALIEFR